jgi:hypothetical protein
MSTPVGRNDCLRGAVYVLPCCDIPVRPPTTRHSQAFRSPEVDQKVDSGLLLCAVSWGLVDSFVMADSTGIP